MKRCVLTALFSVVVLLSAGCLQVEMTVQMHDDGGATITERLCFSQMVLELDAETPTAQKLARLLDRAAIEQRMREMGKGVSLVSHEVVTLADGARQSTAVYRIPEIDDLRLVNPYLASGDPNRLMRLRFSPIHQRVHSFHKVGDLMLDVAPAEPRQPTTQPQAIEQLTPQQAQMFRDLGPVAAEMMNDFFIRLRLIATKPVSLGHIRDHAQGTRTIDLISFAYSDMDAYGSRFLENEELMLSLIRMDFDAENIADHVQGSASNPTVPVFRCRKPYASGRFRVQPTRHQFQKYFAGKPKSQGGDQPG